MKQRCYNRNSSDYKYYGGRNISVCAEWLDTKSGWLSFEKWALDNGYADNLTIDRIDVNKGYSPDNCQWVSMKEQANNTTRNHLITYKGKTQSLSKWADELGLRYELIKKRINQLHWSPEKALETEGTYTNRTRIFYKGKTQCLKHWCYEVGLNYNTVYTRIYENHWSIEKALETPSRKGRKKTT